MLLVSTLAVSLSVKLAMADQIETKVDPELESLLNSGNLSALVPIIIILKDQPQYQASMEVKQRYLPLIKEHKERVRTIYQQLRNEWLQEGYSEYGNSTSLYEYEVQSLTDEERQTDFPLHVHHDD